MADYVLGRRIQAADGDPITESHSRDLSGRGAARTEDAQGTPTQRHISPSVLVYKEKRNLGAVAGGVPLAADGAQLGVDVPCVFTCNSEHRRICTKLHGT